jgi:hypothetical protein
MTGHATLPTAQRRGSPLGAWAAGYWSHAEVPFPAIRVARLT